MIKPTGRLFSVKQMLCWLLMLLMMGAPAYGYDLQDQVSISGFLSIGGGVSNVDALGVVNDPNDNEDRDNPNLETPKYAEGGARFVINDDFDFNSGTRSGIQVDFEMSRDTSATLQIVSKGTHDNYDPDLAWLYLSHRITPKWKINAGRFRAPLYMVSDFLDLGFAYPWIRPPVEVYTQINMENMTGVALHYQNYWQGYSFHAQPFIGTGDNERGAESVARFRKIGGINLSFSTDTLTLRAAFLRYDISFEVADGVLSSEVNEAVDLLIALGFQDTVDYLANNEKSTFRNVGFTYQPNQLKIMGEWARRNSQRNAEDVEGWYVTAGYQLGNWFPHITYAMRDERNASDRIPPQIDEIANVSTELAEGVLGYALQLFSVEDNEAVSITIGTKYNFSNSVVGKLEVMQTRNIESTGFYEFATKDDVNYILRIALDVVF